MGWSFLEYCVLLSLFCLLLSFFNLCPWPRYCVNCEILCLWFLAALFGYWCIAFAFFVLGLILVDTIASCVSVSVFGIAIGDPKHLVSMGSDTRYSSLG